MALPPITVTPHTEIDVEDSCNCCWGRRQPDPRPPLERSYNQKNPPPELVRDSHDVYNFDVVIESPKGHRREPTTYPKEKK